MATNTPDTYWSVDGVSLQTYAQNISTLGGLDTPPEPRGDDITVPYSVGDVWVPKVMGSRVIPLQMWVRGANQDGSTPANRRDSYDDNWRALRNLLWQPGRQFLLKKRFRVGGLLRTATALAEFQGGLAPTMMGRYASRFTVDLKLANPYFYDDVATTSTLINGDQTVTVLGDAPTENIILTINGARTNVIVRNKTLGMQVGYEPALLTGENVRLEMNKFKAITTPNGSAAYRSSALVSHLGAPQWLSMKNGASVINLAASFGTGAVILETRGAWL